MEIKFFIFAVEIFQFPKFHDSEAKHDKCKVKNKILNVTFKVINSWNNWKNWIKILQEYLFVWK